MDSSTVVWIAGATWRWRWLALLAVAVVMIADAIITWQSPHAYLARTSLLIGPSSTVDPGQLVYSVDALGRAMIVGTYANVLDTDSVRRDALQAAGLAPDPTDPAIEIKAAALADSAVIQVTAIAPDPQLAAAIANSVGSVGRVRMSELYPMYDLTVVTQATPPTAVYRPDVKRNLSLGALVGAFVGVSFACAMNWCGGKRSDA